MGKMIALALLAYAIDLLLGEAMRDVTCRAVDPRHLSLGTLSKVPTVE
jgi:hypothetical protein